MRRRPGVFCGGGRRGYGLCRDTEDFFVIIGNGIAGLSAAEEIRKEIRLPRFVMISDEPYDTYNRPMLTKSMLAGLTPEQTAVHEPEWYEKHNIIRVLGRRVASVDTEIKQVVLEDGTKMVYTKLIYALGAESFIPPIRGAGQEHVAAVRRLADVQKICEMLPDIKVSA